MIRSAFEVVENPMAEGGCSCGTSFTPKNSWLFTSKTLISIKIGLIIYEHEKLDGSLSLVMILVLFILICLAVFN